MPMKLYENIKALRIAQNMTQDELAEKVGYKSRASITHVENGDINLSQQRVIKFADALGVSPGDLIGFKEGQPDCFSDEERSLIHRFRRLNKKGRETAIARVEELAMITKYVKRLDE